MNVTDSKNRKVYSTTYPVKCSGRSTWWRDCMITGDGENGTLAACDPLNDTIIYQHMMFNMPTNDRRDTPYLAEDLEKVRQDLIKGENPETPWTLQYDYSFHPGHQLSLKFLQAGAVRDYYRWTDYETAEVGLHYADDSGEWERRTFASREDHVVVTHITSPSKDRISLEVAIDAAGEMNWECREVDANLRYRQYAAMDGAYIGQAAHYPVYENSEIQKGGFAGVTYIVTKGGQKTACEAGKLPDVMAAEPGVFYKIRITDAEEVFLITKSDRDLEMGTMEEFLTAGAEEPAVFKRLVSELERVIHKEIYRKDDFLEYEALLRPHAEKHGAEFNRVRFAAADLDENSDRDSALPNEELIEKQQMDKNRLNAALTERAFNAGRYAAVCAGGLLAPRLGGLWTGAWNGNWQADWTTDANVNLQMAGANIGALKGVMEGYINFILQSIPDWEENAEMIYGMSDAVMAPPRTDGERSGLVHFNAEYPFQYWNTGASWLLLPLFEYWRCCGNVPVPIGEGVEISRLASVLSMGSPGAFDQKLKEIEERGYFMLAEDLMLPLLTKQANFWKQLTDPRYYEDKEGNAGFSPDKTELEEGEHYLLLPCYSPENHPKNSETPITINASMDIAAARDGLRMVIAVEEAVGGEEGRKAAAGWKDLYRKLPEIKYDETGALREWALERYTENHAHRHISHAYFAWPAHESRKNPEIAAGLATTLKLRKENAADKKSGHGWLHTGLVDARLKNGGGVTEALLQLLTNKAYYSSFTTNHNITGDSTYCSDILITIPALILESLVYSDWGEIEILPALPYGLPKGCVEGVLARTEAEIRRLNWDLEAKRASVVICSNIDQEILLSCGLSWESAAVRADEETGYRADSKGIHLAMKKGECVTVEFDLVEVAD